MVRATAALAAALMGQGAARADPPPADAAELAHRVGKQAFADGDYPAAAERFDQAYRLSGDPTYLFNLAQAKRLAGDCRAAHRSYLAFLDRMPDAPNRADVEGKIAELERCARPPVRLTPVPVPVPVADAGADPLAIARRSKRRARTRRLGITVAVISALTMAAAIGVAAAEPEEGMPVVLVAIPVGVGLVTGGVIRQVSDNRRAAAPDP